MNEEKEERREGSDERIGIRIEGEIDQKYRMIGILIEKIGFLKDGLLEIDVHAFNLL